MRKVCRDYATIFNEIEENPSCIIHWSLTGHATISRPRFVPLVRRNRLQPDSGKLEEPINDNTGLLVMQNRGDEKLQPASSRLGSIGTDLESLNTDEPAASLQPDLIGNTSQWTDLPTALVEHKEDNLQLHSCCVDDRLNCDVSVDRASGDDCDSVTVVNSDALPENLQAPRTGLPGCVL